MKHTFLIAGLVVALMSTGCQQDADGVVVNSDNPRQTDIDKLVDEQLTPYLKAKQPSQVIVAITKNGTTKFYGYSLASAPLPNEKSVFEIGSVTKTFTGLLIAREVKVGNIKLDAPVTKYLDPSDQIKLERGGIPVTVKHLLTHTSGLPANPPSIEAGLANGSLDPQNPARNYSRANLISDMKAASLESNPGQRYVYSNFGYAILGEVLRAATGKSFQDNLATLNAELGLVDTGIILSADERSRLVKGHDEFGKEVEAWEMGEAAAAAGVLRSTGEDMMRYVNSYINATPAALPLNDVHAPLFSIDDSQQVGYAWNRVGTSAPYAVWHNGETNGQRCFVGFYENTKAGVVVIADKAEGEGSDQLDIVGLTLLVKVRELNP